MQISTLYSSTAQIIRQPFDGLLRLKRPSVLHLIGVAVGIVLLLPLAYLLLRAAGAE